MAKSVCLGGKKKQKVMEDAGSVLDEKMEGFHHQVVGTLVIRNFSYKKHPSTFMLVVGVNTPGIVHQANVK